MLSQVSIATKFWSMGEFTMWSFWHSTVTNWSMMAARAQMEQVKAGRIQPQGHEIHGRLVHNLCTDTIIHKAAYSSCKTMFLHACNKSDHLQLRPEAAIILQFLCCFGNVTSWNNRRYWQNSHNNNYYNFGNMIEQTLWLRLCKISIISLIFLMIN